MENISFFFKKIISAIILPEGIISLSLLLAVFFMPVKRLRNKVNMLVTVSCLMYFAFGSDYVSFWLVNCLEQKAVSLEKSSTEDIASGISKAVVLSGGAYHDDNKTLATEDRLGDRTRARLLMAALFVKQHEISEIILTGGCAHAISKCERSEAYLMADFLESFLKKTVKITTENQSRDTVENLQNVWKLTGDSPFFLITSAMHMPRACMIAKRFNLNVVPVPCDFQAHRTSGSVPGRFWPSFHNLQRSMMAMHEYVGIWWLSLTYIFARH